MKRMELIKLYALGAFLAITITGCEKAHTWIDNTLGIHDEEHTTKEQKEPMGIWEEDKNG